MATIPRLMLRILSLLPRALAARAALASGPAPSAAPRTCGSSPCACDDAPPSVDEARRQSDHVVVGRVVRRELVRGTLDDSIATPGPRRWTAQLITVAVERGWWGLQVDTVRLVARTDCDADLMAPEGARSPAFLLYAVRLGPIGGTHLRVARPSPGAGDDGRLVSSIEVPIETLAFAARCGRTRPLDDARDDLRALGPAAWWTRR